MIAPLAVLLLAAPRAQEAPRQTFRASTRLVTIDALVHGRDGEPIRNLTAADFTLFEDGKQQRIELFEVVGAGGPSARSAAASSPASQSPSTFTNRPGGNAPPAVTVVLFDRLNTRFEDQVTARAEIIAFLKQLRSDQRIAIYLLESNTIRVLHDFTRDTASLVNTMSRYRAQTSIEQAVADAPVLQAMPAGTSDIDAEMQAWLQETMADVAAEYTRRRGQITYDALEAIAAHLSGIPGRKNLVWVSAAFPIVISDLLGPQSMSREMTRAAQAVNNANLSIYPIDVRGLVAPYSGASATETYQKVGRGGAPTVPSVTATMQPNIDTMAELAARTGGRAFVNTNAIGRAIEQAIDDARVTYLLGYYPTNTHWDGKFRKLKVTVRAPGAADAEIRYRSGFLAVPAPSRAENRMADLLRSPLDSTAIGLDVSYENSVLTMHVAPAAITLTPNGDEWEAALDILIAETMLGGELVKHLDRTLNLRLNRDQRADLLREGFSMTRTIERRFRDSRLHIIVRDAPTGKAGSIAIQ